MKNSDSNKRIRELLNELDISQTEFCKKTGINKSALSNYLNGDRAPRQDQIDKIAQAYNINPSWLMGYDVPKTQNPSDILVLDPSTDSTIFVFERKDKKSDIYTELLEVAHKCTEEQVMAAINMLIAYSRANHLESYYKTLAHRKEILKHREKIRKEAKKHGKGKKTT